MALKQRIDAFHSNDAFKEVTRSKCRELKKSLDFEKTNSLEKLAIEQIVISWLNYYQTEMRFASTFSNTTNSETALYWEKRLSFASRRYNRALDTLYKMRKMNLVVQVNQAHNQIVNNE